jgi:tetratricopeptide (TPR) repeat protein
MTLAESSPNMMAEAIGAARAGDRARAREILARLLRSDSANAEYWVWMSAVVDTPRERIYCLESALDIDPTNRAALRGLVVLGARKPEDSKRQKPKVPKRRVAQVARARPQPALRLNARMVGGVLLGLVGLGALGGLYVLLRNFPVGTFVAPSLPTASYTPTVTPDIPTATNTPVPAETRAFRTPIPTELAGTPIGFFVEATPTSTPILGLTPHPSFEAYGAGIAALQRGDYEAAIEFMRQVVELDATLVDAHYFLGEALRLDGQPGQATQAYDRATLLNADFAPAYVGRGLARLDIILRENGEFRASDLPGDFDSAIRRDPLLTVAYLHKAEFFGNLRVWSAMEETLQDAIDAGVHEPLVYIRMSEAEYNRERLEESLESAIEGSAGDPTNLEGYKAIGRALVALERFDEALWPLQTYVAYVPDDHAGWAHLARAELARGDLTAARQAAERSLEINDRYAPGYLARAIVKLETGEYQSAYDDMLQARRFGVETYELIFSYARAFYHLGRYVEAVRQVNTAISLTEDPARKSDGYALRALVYEGTNPPLLDEARLNWQWILDTEGARPSALALAEIHLAALSGEGPTLTPVPSQTPTGQATVAASATPTP